jgi:hypothetical protein
VTKRRIESMFRPAPRKATAHDMVAAERRDHEAKTERLRAARKARDAEERSDSPEPKKAR